MLNDWIYAQDQASEAMEVFNELMESEVSIIVPHVADIVRFCLEVGVECLYFLFFPVLCVFISELTTSLTHLNIITCTCRF